MMGEKTDHAAVVHVVVMSVSAMAVALTCRGSKLECFHRNLLHKRTSSKSLKYPQKWLSRIANSRHLY